MRPKLLIVTDERAPWERNLAAVEAAAALGAEVGVLYRDRSLTARAYLERARPLAQVCARGGAAFFVHGRLDVALLLGAHLHLPVEAPSPAAVRPHLPPGTLVSASVHDAAELRAAVAGGADLVLVAPVFAPGSKPGDGRPPLGPEGFRTLVAGCPVPALALGGLTPERIRALAPLAGAAVVSAVVGSEAPLDAARRLLAALA